jgi:sulfoxide reductase heme-binding subunit YedZ
MKALDFKSWDTVARTKPVVFLLCLAPFFWLVWLAVVNDLGPDPAKSMVDGLGLWAIRMLFLCLAMTPMRLLTGRSYWIRYRRMLGLFALYYALLHLSAYTFLLFGARWSQLGHELVKRPYIIVGAAAILLMLPLGLTSTRGWQRRLKRRWVALHKLVYAVSLLALIHFTWLKKLGIYVTWPYAVVLFLLLGVRVWSYFGRSVKESATSG